MMYQVCATNKKTGEKLNGMTFPSKDFAESQAKAWATHKMGERFTDWRVETVEG